MASGKHCVFAAATGIIYYMTRSRNCGLQKISGGSWRFPGGGVPPRKHAWLKHWCNITLWSPLSLHVYIYRSLDCLWRVIDSKLAQNNLPLPASLYHPLPYR